MSSPPQQPPATRMRRLAALWPLAVALVAALVGYQLVFGLRLVAAGDPYWSNPHGDMGQMLAGELAGLRAPWSLPILTPDTMTAPDRVSLVYTDSIPWLTALLKLLHLGRTFSLMGTFLLLAWLAQPLAMWALLRASGVRHGATLAVGALLALMVPAWLWRQIGHIALSGHAIEIAALALAVQAIRHGADGRTTTGFVALGVAATGVHAYHLPPVTLMLAAAAASDVLQRREGAVRRAALSGAAYVLAVGVSAWLLGYFVGRGASGGVDALGVYEMNLFSPLFPANSSLIPSGLIGARLIHLLGPAQYQDFEGYNYVGVGGLVLLAAAAALLWRERRGGAPGEVVWRDAAAGPPLPAMRDPEASWARRWGPLAAALAILTLYALGTQPYAGALRLLVVPLPRAPWMEPLALFRAHGRFFWTVGYALLAGALTVVDRSAGPRLRAVVLVAAVLLQWADTRELRHDLRVQFADPAPLKVPAALTGPRFRGRDLRVFPGLFCTTSQENIDRIRQLSIIAQRNGASTNVAETARPPPVTCPVPAPDLRADAAPGDRRITIVMRGDVLPTPVTNALSGRSDCFAGGEGLWLCGRDLLGTPGLRPVAGEDLATATTRDAALDIAGPALRAALAAGWSTPEATGVWSDGPRAVLRLPHPALPPGAVLSVDLEMLGYQPPGRAPQRVHVSLPDGTSRDLTPAGDGYATVELRLPARSLPPGPVELAFDLPDAVSPNAVQPGSGDPRRLGIGLRKVTLAH